MLLFMEKPWIRSYGRYFTNLQNMPGWNVCRYCNRFQWLYRKRYRTTLNNHGAGGIQLPAACKNNLYRRINEYPFDFQSTGCNVSLDCFLIIGQCHRVQRRFRTGHQPGPYQSPCNSGNCYLSYYSENWKLQRIQGRLSGYCESRGFSES